MYKDPRKRYTISIDTAILVVSHVIVIPSVRESHEMALFKANAKYPIRQVDMRYFAKELIFINGILPRPIIIALVDSYPFSGNCELNPMCFDSYNVESVILRLNGKLQPYPSLEMSFEDYNFLQTYITFLQGTNRLCRDVSISMG